MNATPTTDEGPEPSEQGDLGARFPSAVALVSDENGTLWRAFDRAAHRAVLVRELRADRVPARSREGLWTSPHLADTSTLSPLLEVEGRNGSLRLLCRDAPGLPLVLRFRHGRLAVADVLALAEALLQALVSLHAAGVYGRQLDPSTLLVAPEFGALRSATLLDFGLSQLDFLQLSVRELSARVMRYFSPEAAGLLERDVDARSDLFSLGTVLFEALTGRPLLKGEGVGEVLRQYRLVRAFALRGAGLRAPRALEELVLRLVAYLPEDRYQTAAAALDDVRELQTALRRGESDPPMVVGTRDLRRHLTPSGFVGRLDELQLFDGQLRRATEGNGGLVRLESEAGGGKSRLLAEWGAQASSRGARLFRAHGHQRFGMLEGLEASIRVAASLDPQLALSLQHRLGEEREAVCEALPELAALLHPRTALPRGPESTGETRTVRALAALLGALGDADRPAVVLLDDCQWVPELWGKALGAWLRASAGPRYVLVVAAYRTEDTREGHPLRLLAPAVGCPLPGFERPWLEQLVRSMAGPVPAPALDLVTRLSEGSPFMASAILGGLVESGALVPSPTEGWEVDPHALARTRPSRKAAAYLAKRLRLLPPPTVRLLSIGAVLGATFEVAEASDLAGIPAAAGAEALEVAARRHMIWPDGAAGRMSFVHELVQGATLELVPEAERRRLHRLVAERLSARPGAFALELACHFDEAGEPGRAMPYALATAQSARARYALEQAERFYLMAERGAGASDARLQRQIAEGLGDTLMLRGKYAEARPRFETALCLATLPTEQAVLHGKLGELAFKRGSLTAGAKEIERALALLGRRVPRSKAAYVVLALVQGVVQLLHTAFPSLFLARRPLEGARLDLLRVRLYSRLGYSHWFLGGFFPTLWAHLRELNLAERFPPTRELGQAYADHTAMMSTLPRFRRAFEYARRGLQIRRDLHDVWGEGQSLHFRGIVEYGAGRYTDAVASCAKAVQLLQSTGDRWEANSAYYNRALAQLALGQRRAAAAAGQSILRTSEEIGDRHAARFGLVCWAKATDGDVPWEVISTELARPKEDPQTFQLVLQAQGLWLLRHGQPRAAAAAFEEAVRRVSEIGLRNMYVAPLPALWARALRCQAEGASGYLPQAREALLARAAQVARQAVAKARRFPNSLPLALREQGLVHAMRGNARRAFTCLERSVAEAHRQGAVYEHALSLEARGRVGALLGWPASARKLAAAQRALSSQALEAVVPKAPSLSLADRFEGVLEAGRRIVSAVGRDAVLESARTSALTLLRAEACEVVGPGTRSGPLVARALETRRPQLSLPAPGEEATAAELCAPILLRDAPVACLRALHRDPQAFGDDELRLAEFVTTLAGAGLENAEGFAAEKALSEQRERLYQEAREGMRRRDEFLALAAHELKTPLTPLQVRVQTLLRGAPEGTDPARWVRERLERVDEQVHRLSRLVQTLLDVSVLSEGPLALERAPVDLSEAAREAVARLMPQALRNGLVTVSTPGPVVGLWDRLRLEQAIGVLLSNAVKYGAGKQIEVRVERAEERARLRVKDRGIGISAADQARIFERFERAVSYRHYGGFGLGLWIARRVVRALGGEVAVESALGEGATFTLELPFGERC